MEEVDGSNPSRSTNFPPTPDSPRIHLSFGSWRRRLEVAFGEGDKRRPVRPWSVAATMLAERHVAIDQRGLDGRKLGGPHVLLAQQLVDGPGGGRGHEAALSVYPAVAVGGAGADEYRARRAHGDQLVRIHRQIAPVQRTGVFEEVAGHPVVFAAPGDVLHDFSPIAAVQ